MLEIRELSKKYANPAGRNFPPVMALTGVTLSLQAGEFVAICGPSGSGKSTLLMITGGLLTPSEGKVTFHGRDIYEMAPEARARWRAQNVGFMFQQFHLIPYLSVLDNVLAPVLAWPMPDPRRRGLELLDRFGLGDRAAHVPGQLSAGEQQRVALARAMFHQPQLLLCDEPSGNLDDLNAGIVFQHLQEFHRAGGTVLLITHDSSATAMAQRTLHLQAGKLVDGK